MAARPSKRSVLDVLLSILEAVTAFKEHEFTTTQLQRAAGISYETAYRYLHELEERGYVEGWMDYSIHTVRGIYRWRRIRGVVQVGKKRPSKTVEKTRRKR